ncbi:glycosyltransferase family 4 protein [Streptosporangium sp. NPDC000509]|uniref:glycosyltransferase family 4 protein n=1 Tax=Streptosporangium sp. NPDC000509 TaxID=3366186 RepID=UPI0036CF11C6
MIIRAAVRAGHMIVPCCVVNEATASVSEDLGELGLTVTPWELGSVEDDWISWGTVEEQRASASRVLSETDPDAVLLFLPEPDSSVGILVACAEKDVPTVAVFTVVPPGYPVSPENRARGALARRGRQLWVAISEDNRRQLIDAFGIEASTQIPVVRNGRNLPAAWRDPEPARVDAVRVGLRAELGIPSASRVVLTVATLSVSKGHLDLLNAIPLLSPSHADVHFVWAGDGWERDRLEAAIAVAGLSHRVHMIGYRTDVPALLHAADLFVFPSHSEGYSLAVIEAMSAGLPIIAADVSSTPEQLGHGRYGLLSPVGDPTALAERLDHALSNPARMRALANAALLAGRAMTEEAMCAATLQLVEDMVSSP